MVMPSHQPTEQNRRTVESMSGYGIPHVEIARVIAIDAKTLRKHYREELDTGPVKANAKVAESLFLQACGAPAVYDSNGNKIRDEQARVPSTGIWWTKARMGWRETVASEITGKDGGPIETKEVSPRERIASRITGVATRIGAGQDNCEPDGS